jgi:hypothetical protein
MTTDTPENELENLPDASRLIYGLRDTGYNFLTAAADIVDNSIAAHATQANVLIELLEDGKKFVYFGDNGDGMDYKELFDAMRYGAKAREDLASLGKFGLGLKTASSSVCIRFTVVSRKKATANFAKLAWDLDYVRAEDNWEMIKDEVSADELDLFNQLCGEKGTLVIWSKCDRLLSKQYETPGGSGEKAAIKRISTKLVDHFGLIYYRFLNHSDVRASNINISVNGEEVVGWDPFFPARSEQLLSPAQQKVECELLDGSTETATLKAWILPHRKDCTKEEERLANHSNKGQGFYVLEKIVLSILVVGLGFMGGARSSRTCLYFVWNSILAISLMTRLWLM